MLRLDIFSYGFVVGYGYTHRILDNLYRGYRVFIRLFEKEKRRVGSYTPKRRGIAGKKEKALSFFLWYAVIAVGVVATAYTYIAGLMR